MYSEMGFFKIDQGGNCNSSLLSQLTRVELTSFLRILLVSNLNNLFHFKDSPVLSPANSAINLSGAQDLTRNVVKPLALSLQVVGKTFAAGDVFLTYISLVNT